MNCPGCGAAMKPAVMEGGDKIYACPHCRRTIDVPDVEGTTHEKITESPGLTVTERRTEWTSRSPVDPDLTGSLKGLPGGGLQITKTSDGGGFSFQVGDKTFKSVEDLKKYLLSLMPLETVEKLLKFLRF